MLAHMVQDCLHNNGRFPWIAPILKYSVRYKVVLYAQRGIVVVRRRENDEIPLIKLMIRECNQAVMAGPIVPAQPAYRLEQRARNIKNALPFLNGGAVIVGALIVGIEGHALKKGRRRKLFRIAHNDNLPSSRECADGVFWLELGRLVHDDEIEFELSGSKVLGNRQGPHHKARLEGDQG